MFILFSLTSAVDGVGRGRDRVVRHGVRVHPDLKWRRAIWKSKTTLQSMWQTNFRVANAWSSLVVGDEGCIGPKDPLLCL